MNAHDLFRSGQLAAAIESATQDVKSQPTDPSRRSFLFELLSFAGEFDRAEKQLDVIAHGDEKSEWAVQVYRNILAAERTRRREYSEGLKPEFLLDPPDYVRLHLEAINRIRDHRPAEAVALLQQSEEARPALAGQLDGTPFDEFRDCDDMVAPFLEFIIVRDYAWVPFEQILELEVSAPERPRDLIWPPVRIELSDGSQRRGYTPALYHGSHQHADDAIRLGRMTDWIALDDGPIQGVGQRLFLAGEEDRPLLEVRSLNFAAGG